jgi:hypothetical protein
MLKTSFLILLPFLFTSCASLLLSKENRQEQIVGIWVREDTSSKDYLQLKKVEQFQENTSCYHFKENGKVIMQVPLGDQLWPNYIITNGKWRMLSRDVIEIDRLFPGEDPDKMKILKFTSKEIRFEWE